MIVVMGILAFIALLAIAGLFCWALWSARPWRG